MICSNENLKCSFPEAILILISVTFEFSLSQIEYPLGGSSQKCSHVYFLLIVAMVLLLWCQIVLLWHHDYLFCYCPLVCILFEVLRIILVFSLSVMHHEIKPQSCKLYIDQPNKLVNMSEHRWQYIKRVFEPMLLLQKVAEYKRRQSCSPVYIIWCQNDCTQATTLS